MSKSDIDQPIPFTVVDPDAPIPFRVRVATPGPEMRSFVVPALGVRGIAEPPVPEERRSGPRLKVAKVA